MKLEVLLPLVFGCAFATLGCKRPLESRVTDSGPANAEIQSLLDSVKRLEVQLDELKNPQREREPVLSEAERKEILRIEDFVTNGVSARLDEKACDEAIKSFQALNEKMSPEVQRAEVQRLLALNWNLAAVRWLARLSADEVDQSALSDDATSLLDDPMPGAKPELKVKLEAGQKELQDRIKKRELASLMDRINTVATEVDKCEKDVNQDNSKVIRSALLEIEDRLRVLDIGEDESQELRNRVVPLVDRVDVSISIAEVTAQKRRLPSISVQVERQSAINQLLQSVVALRVRIILDGKEKSLASALDLLDKLRTELIDLSEAEAKLLVDKQESKRRKYQAWALARVDDVRKNWTTPAVQARIVEVTTAGKSGSGASLKAAGYPAVREVIKKDANVALNGKEISAQDATTLYNLYGGLTGKSTLGIVKTATREAMIDLLLRIDTRLLDQPVADIYQNVWSELWTSLEGAEEDHRLKVAEAASTISKYTLEDFPQTP